MLPQVILLPFAGVLVDRTSRVRLMIGTETIRCILLAALALMAATHHLYTGLLDGFVVLYGVMDALFQPAYSAARAQVFTPDIRNAAISLSQVSQQVARLLGPAIGGMIVGFASVAAGFGIDAVMLLLSVLILTRLHVPAPERVIRAESALRNFLHELTGGFVELRKHEWLWITIVAFGFINVATGGLTTILVPWLIKVHLGLSATSYGLVSSASGIGALCAAFVYGRRKQWHRRGYMAYSGVVVSALALLSLSLVTTTALLMLLMAIEGASVMVFLMIWENSLQELVPPASYGRVASLDLFGSWTLLPVGNVFTGWLATRVGGIHTMWIESIFALCVAGVVLSVRAIRRFD